MVDKRSLTDLCAPLGIGFRIPNCRTRYRCNFKGRSQLGGRAELKKISVPHSLMTTYRMNLISAGAISLDNTFPAQSTYFTVRGQSYFSRLPKYWPPITLSDRRVFPKEDIKGQPTSRNLSATAKEEFFSVHGQLQLSEIFFSYRCPVLL